MNRTYEKQYQGTEILVIEGEGIFEGGSGLAIDVQSLRKILGDSDPLKIGVVTLKDHCFMFELTDGTSRMVMVRRAVMRLLKHVGTDAATAFHAWLDVELPNPPEDDEIRDTDIERWKTVMESMPGAKPEAVRLTLNWTRAKWIHVLKYLEKMLDPKTPSDKRASEVAWLEGFMGRYPDADDETLCREMGWTREHLAEVTAWRQFTSRMVAM